MNALGAPFVARLISTRHPDLEFAVTGVYTHDAEAAMARAVTVALAHGSAFLDVLAWSEEGARVYGGDDAVAVYRDDPDATVHDRILVTAQSQGRVA